MVSFIFYLIHY